MELDIAIIDDHVLFAELLSASMAQYPFIKQIRTFTSGAAFLDMAHEPYPNIIITDILMPGMGGLELLKVVRKQNRDVKLIVLSSIAEVQSIRHALRNGANAYLDKGIHISELGEALEEVYAGEQYIGKSLRDSLLKFIVADEQVVYHLSPQQKEVLKHICSGKTIKETAFEMQLSAHTTQTYYRNIMKKFKVNRTVDLIVFAMKNGLYTEQQEGTQ